MYLLTNYHTVKTYNVGLTSDMSDTLPVCSLQLFNIYLSKISRVGP